MVARGAPIAVAPVVVPARRITPLLRGTLADGVVRQGNFHQLAMPRMADSPRIDVHVVPSDDDPTGMGEPALPPLAPALANALARLGLPRQRQLPFDLSRT